jgi:hypothetical protein
VAGAVACEDRSIIGPDVFSRPTYQAFDFISGYSEVAEHAIIHAGELDEGATPRQFGVDRLRYCFQDRKDSCDAEARERAPSRPAARQNADAMDFVERLS